MKGMLTEEVSSLDLQRAKEITLLEVLDKALNKGVIIGGDLVISVADVDLLYVGIKILLSSIETMKSLRMAQRSMKTHHPFFASLQSPALSAAKNASNAPLPSGERDG